MKFPIFCILEMNLAITAGSLQLLVKFNKNIADCCIRNNQNTSKFAWVSHLCTLQLRTYHPWNQSCQELSWLHGGCKLFIFSLFWNLNFESGWYCTFSDTNTNISISLILKRNERTYIKQQANLHAGHDTLQLNQ